MVDTPPVRWTAEELLDRVLEPDLLIGLRANDIIEFVISDTVRIHRARVFSPGKADIIVDSNWGIPDRVRAIRRLNNLIESGVPFTSSVLKAGETFKFTWTLS